MRFVPLLDACCQGMEQPHTERDEQPRCRYQPSLIAERADRVNHSILSFFRALFAHGTLRQLARLSGTNGLVCSVHIGHVEWISPPQQGPEAF